MKIVFVVTVLTCTLHLFWAKPFNEERSYIDDRPHCPESNDEPSDSINAEVLRPRPSFDSSERFSAGRQDFNQKRSLDNNLVNVDSQVVEKRQVGVIYRDEKPIGILQPYLRTYRFIPVKEENAYESELNLQGMSSNNLALDKRSVDMSLLDETYPSILANFKIDNKLDKKRNYDAITDSNVQDLKATIRKLRSNTNNEQFEEELKSILDEMGLIEDDDLHGNKREISENYDDDDKDVGSESKLSNERGKREDCYGDKSSDQNSITGNNLMTVEDKNEVKNDPPRIIPINKREDVEDTEIKTRKKRQKADGNIKQGSELVEDLKESGDLMVSGNKSPLASSEVINTREVNANEAEGESEIDDNNRIEREIQDKINNLKDEVKREIEALKERQKDDGDGRRRRRRHTPHNLIDEENSVVDPVMNPSESEMKPLIRKRRSTDDDSFDYSTIRQKRGNERAPDMHAINEDKKKKGQDNAGGELLDGDDLTDEINKRNINYNKDYQDFENENIARLRRSHRPRNLDFYDQFGNNNEYVYDEDNDRLKRESFETDGEFYPHGTYNNFFPIKSRRIRFRRRINDAQEGRPQQLSDMSDVDLFGALPKSYEGELSRFKRVKRKFGNRNVL